MRIAAFISHPIQYFTPLWQELSLRPGVELQVFYFSRQGLERTRDAEFGVSFAWNIDLLAGHRHQFLPRQWPTKDPAAYGTRALNRGFATVLGEGWDVVFVSGYTHLNNWLIAAECARRGLPMICYADTNPRTDLGKPLAKRLAKQAVIRAFASRMSAFVVAGGQTRGYLARYGVAPESVFVCPYAVDVARFRAAVEQAGREGMSAVRRAWGVADSARVVMFCGKLVARKRPLDVLRACLRLNRTDVVPVFVGEGELRAELEREGAGKAVLTGFVNQAEMPVVLATADVIVLSSDFEPYGMVVAEAQCLGVPAVVSDACGCWGPQAVVDDGGSGFVYPTGDVQALADRIARILDDAALNARMRAAALRQGETQSQVRAADGFLDAARHALQRPR